jgi:hypothetical protein
MRAPKDDVFCACVGARRAGAAKPNGCGETLCKAVPLPDVLLAVTGDVARAGGVWCGLPWRIYAESAGDAARVQVRVAPRPGERATHVADVTVHAPYDQSLTDEVQAVAAALLWSRLRAGWLESER